MRIFGYIIAGMIALSCGAVAAEESKKTFDGIEKVDFSRPVDASLFAVSDNYNYAIDICTLLAESKLKVERKCRVLFRSSSNENKNKSQIVGASLRLQGMISESDLKNLWMKIEKIGEGKTVSVAGEVAN